MKNFSFNDEVTILEFLKYTNEGEVGIVEINRPSVLNALNRALLQELQQFLEETVKDEQLKVLIVTGAGGKAFIAGADIKEMEGMTHTDVLGFCELGQNVTHLFQTAHCVTIAAVNGYALGGGLEMALACDFIYASTEAKLGFPEVSLGIIPGFGGTQRLSRAIGQSKAKEMIVTGKTITAEEGERLGLINKVCAPEKLLSACLETAEMITKHSSIALQQGKNAVNFGYQLGIHEALDIERNMFAVCFATEERKVAMEMFLKRGS